MVASRRFVRVVCSSAWLVWFAVAAAGQEADGQGRIEGRIARADGRAVPGVSVVLVETSDAVLSDNNGTFSFAGVPAGVYSLSLASGPYVITVSNVVVSGRQTATIEEIVDWDVGFSEDLIVVATSRRLERTVEAPASVTRVSEQEIAQRASSGQVPKLLEFTPGAELTQSGLYDFNFNTRGFNSSLNRRVATIIDGRDPSSPFLGAQEWAAITFPLDELASLELVRGPSAALYGPNASGGVLDMTTKEPRFNQGGLARVSFGELETVNADFRWAGDIGNNWYLKTLGGVRDSGDFTVSRDRAVEYSAPCAPGAVGDCLPREAVPLARLSDDQIFFGGIRLDKHLDGGVVFTAEGGIADIAGPVSQTGIGRVQVLDSTRPWARFNVSSDHFNVMTAYTGRHAPEQLALGPGTNVALDEHRFQVEAQTNWSLADDQVTVVTGVSAAVEKVDSFDAARGMQTLLFAPVDENRRALFGQVDWNVTERLKLVGAARGDFGSLYDFQFSPKGSVVYQLARDHGVRFTYNEAFQVPNHAEFFLQVDAAPPADLSGLNGVCAAFGVDCGFGPTRVLAVGNEDLALEHIRTWELGYKGVLGGRAFVTVDYYRSDISNLVTDLLPQVGTPLGRINPNFGPWQGPAGLPDAAVALVRRLAPPILTNNIDGSNLLAAVSFTTFGEVDTQGVEVGVQYQLPAGWSTSFAYSWLDLEAQDALPGVDELLLPNAPEHSASTGLTYTRGKVYGDLSVRWVDTFRWVSGPFQGDVEAYATVDLTASYDLTDRTAVSLNVANLLDNTHWEAFGGDLLRRRALVSLDYRW